MGERKQTCSRLSFGIERILSLPKSDSLGRQTNNLYCNKEWHRDEIIRDDVDIDVRRRISNMDTRHEIKTENDDDKNDKVAHIERTNLRNKIASARNEVNQHQCDAPVITPDVISDTTESYCWSKFFFDHVQRSSILSHSDILKVPSHRHHIATPTWASSYGLPWMDIRRDRFGFVRRIGHPYQNRTPAKRKKPRTSFTRTQIVELENRFYKQKYLASVERSSLAKQLQMTDAQVKTWFQNRRTKWRRQTAEEREAEQHAANRIIQSLQTDRSDIYNGQDSMCFASSSLHALQNLQPWTDSTTTEKT